MTLQTTVTASIRATQTNPIDVGTPIFSFDDTTKIALDDGTGANQAAKMWTDTRTIAASGTDSLDLAATLADAFGSVLTFATVKAIKVSAKSTNTNNVVVGGAGSNTFIGMFADPTDKINVKPGGVFLWCAPGTGATVTASTGDILLVANSAGGTSVDYTIEIIGT